MSTLNNIQTFAKSALREITNRETQALPGTRSSGNHTCDFKEMMNELGDNPHCLFGDLNEVVAGINYSKENKQIMSIDFDVTFSSDVKEMGPKDISDLFENGITAVYHEHVWCYLCVRESDFKNYIFFPADSENRENEYKRLRGGVRSFNKEGFKIIAIIR